MSLQTTRRGQTQAQCSVGQALPDNAPKGHPVKNKVILNLFQDLRRKLSLRPWREKVGEARMRGNSLGFTLIEILVVVLIIGILGAIMLPQYQKAVEKSRAMQAFPLLKGAYQAAVLYYMEHGTYPLHFSDMDIEMPGWTGNRKWADLPGVKDTRSNEDWSLQLYHTTTGNLQVYLGRISGKYAGAGFVMTAITVQQGVQRGIASCAERTRNGITFSSNLKAGDYCKKIMGGTLTSDSGTYRAYRLP